MVSVNADLPDAVAAACSGLAVAALVHDAHGEPDALLAAFATAQRAAGYRVRGLLNLASAATADGKCMVLVDVADPRVRYLISQDLGTAACGCSLDPRGLADASAVLRRALHEPAELAIVNRFGTLEAKGQGMAAELLALMVAGIPLLTAVNRRHLEAWRMFSGGLAAELPLDAHALQVWWQACRALPAART
ncbi:MAG: DUF2478 domain-containing protein [Stenotrophomonas sp.]